VDNVIPDCYERSEGFRLRFRRLTNKNKNAKHLDTTRGLRPSGEAYTVHPTPTTHTVFQAVLWQGLAPFLRSDKRGAAVRQDRAGKIGLRYVSSETTLRAH
jgi:hypothetical protein